jgi:hypothetical protein
MLLQKKSTKKPGGSINGKEIGHTSNPDDSVMQLTVKIALDKYCRGTIFFPM